MTAVSCSIPCPSTSKAWGMLPTFATVNVTVPAAMLRAESSTFHSDSLALTAARSPGARCAEAPESATAESSSPAAFRTGTACPYDIRDGPPARVEQQYPSMPETSRAQRLLLRQ